MNKIYPLVLIASTMCFATRIGVLKGDAACNEEVSIRLDTEDSDPSTRLVSGSSYLPGVQIANDKSSIRFRYCVLNVDQNFSNAYRGPYDYAVLMLDNSYILNYFFQQLFYNQALYHPNKTFHMLLF